MGKAACVVERCTRTLPFDVVAVSRSCSVVRKRFPTATRALWVSWQARWTSDLGQLGWCVRGDGRESGRSDYRRRPEDSRRGGCLTYCISLGATSAITQVLRRENAGCGSRRGVSKVSLGSLLLSRTKEFFRDPDAVMLSFAESCGIAVRVLYIVGCCFGRLDRPLGL